jgi:adenylate cyclase
MGETRKLAAILVADIVGYSRLAGADEERTLARVRGLRSDLIDPAIAAHHGRIVKRTGDGSIIEFRSVVDAVRCAIEVQNGLIERNAGLPPEKRIEFRVGIHLGDVVEESDGDLMGDGVNIAARLEGVAKPGGICLSEDAYRQVQGKIEADFVDLGDQHLKNIAQPVRVYSLQSGNAAKARPIKRAGRNARVSVIACSVALILVAGGAVWYFSHGFEPAARNAADLTAAKSVAIEAAKPGATEPLKPAAAHLSIVVLPFANLSGNSAQDYFADCVTDNLTTDLARVKGSFVIARNTAFTYKGKNVDATEIGKALGVRYVLEGSVQRDQNRVRVNAQLIDAESGAHLWAERFEEDVADLFKLQDQVVARLANTLGMELVKAEAEKSARSQNPDLVDFNMRGWAMMQQWLRTTKDYNEEARTWFQKALKIDPNDHDALVGEAYTYFIDYAMGWPTPDFDYESKVLGQVDRVVTLDHDHVWAYYVKTVYLANSKRANEAVGTAEAGLAIDPNFARLYLARAMAEIPLGRFEDAISDVHKAMRLSPRDPEVGWWHNLLATAKFGVGNYQEAVDDAKKAIDGGFRYVWPYATLASAYAAQGQVDDAKSAVAEARRLNPKLTVKWFAPFGMPDLYLEGLRKAGLPEG